MDWTQEIPKKKKLNDDISFPALLQLDEFVVKPAMKEEDVVHIPYEKEFDKGALEQAGVRIIGGTVCQSLRPS